MDKIRSQIDWANLPDFVKYVTISKAGVVKMWARIPRKDLTFNDWRDMFQLECTAKAKIEVNELWTECLFERTI